MIDLFKDDLRHITSDDLYAAIAAFTRVSEPLAVRPREGYVLDFKETWTEKAIQTVAAFAHTFGGLLIVGVSESNGQPDKILGVPSAGELKTSIASSIATNISPTPPYEIAECSLPNPPNDKLVVVRVKKGNDIYYYTKKSQRYPVYVRNEDESVPADAAQLRMLIEEQRNPKEIESDRTERLTFLPSSVGLQLPREGQAKSFNVNVVPFVSQQLTLDSSIENEFRKIILHNFDVLNDRGATEEDKRWYNWYRYRYFLAGANSNETIWQITSAADLGYAREVQLKDSMGTLGWSLADRVIDLICVLRAFADFCKSGNYYGDFRLVANLYVGELKPFRSGKTAFFDSFAASYRVGGWEFNGSGIDAPSKPYQSGYCTLDINIARLKDDMCEIVVNLVNQQLRSLGYGADVNKLRETIGDLLTRFAR